jgi:hypothetical protein
MCAGNGSYSAEEVRTWYRYGTGRLVPSGSSFDTGPTHTYEEVVTDPSLLVPPVFSARLVREVSRRMASMFGQEDLERLRFRGVVGQDGTSYLQFSTGSDQSDAYVNFVVQGHLFM